MVIPREFSQINSDNINWAKKAKRLSWKNKSGKKKPELRYSIS